LCSLNYEELKSGSVRVLGKEVETASLSSYAKAIEIANLLKDEIQRGDFSLSRPIERLPGNQKMKSLVIKDKDQ